MTEINIPINLELRRRGIHVISITNFDCSKVLYVTIESFDGTIVFARYDIFDAFVKESESQILAHPSCFPAEDIEVLQDFLITNRKVIEETAKDLRE